MNLADLANQNQMQRQQMNDDKATRSAFQNNMTTDENGRPTLNRAGVLSDLTKAGLGQKAYDMQRTWNAQDLQQRQAQIDMHMKSAEAFGQIFGGVKDQPTPELKQKAWDQAMPVAEKLGLVDPNNHPKQYDEAYLNGMLGQVMSFKDRLAHQEKSQQLGIDQQKANAETDSVNVKKQDLALQRQKLYGGSGQGPGQMAGKTGATLDPATLVPINVPEHHQAKAFEEIKDAQNISALAPKILAAFDKGSSRNPNEALQGQREFEGLINTTVKEQEGTARQAAFDSIHKKMTPSGLLALPGENDAKRQTVIEYLKSKGSAPTAKAYGIDLSKYPSTSVSDTSQNNSSKAPSDVEQYAKTHGLTVDQAQAIKDQRTGGR